MNEIYYLNLAFLPTSQFKVAFPDTLGYKKPQFPSFQLATLFRPLEGCYFLFSMLVCVMEGTSTTFGEFAVLMPCAFHDDIVSSLASVSGHGSHSSFEGVGFAREITFSFVFQIDDIASTDDVGSVRKLGVG